MKRIQRGWEDWRLFTTYIVVIWFFGFRGWIQAKIDVLKLLVDTFGNFMQHLESLSSDPSVKTADKAKLSGYLRKWKTAKMFVCSCSFIDLLQPSWSTTLSAAFQGRGSWRGKMGAGICLFLGWGNGICALGLGFYHWELDKHLTHIPLW